MHLKNVVKNLDNLAPPTYQSEPYIIKKRLHNGVEAKLHDESREIQRCFDDNKDDNKR